MAAVPSAHIDRKKYSRLLAKTLPRSIRSEEENDRVLKIVERLMDKGEDNLTPEENALLDLLVTLVERFEEDYYQLEKKSSSTPLGILKELMAAREIKPSDLWSVLGSKGLTSEILSGKRDIGKSRARALAEFLHVSFARICGSVYLIGSGRVPCASLVWLTPRR